MSRVEEAVEEAQEALIIDFVALRLAVACRALSENVFYRPAKLIENTHLID